MMKLAVGLGLTALIAIVLVATRSPSSGDSCEPNCEPVLPELDWTEREVDEAAAPAARGSDVSEAAPPAEVTPTPIPVPSCAYYVAPDGSNSATGTQDEPWATITHALRNVPDGGERAERVVRVGLLGVAGERAHRAEPGQLDRVNECSVESVHGQVGKQIPELPFVARDPRWL